MLQILRRKQKYKVSTDAGVEKTKLSRLLVQRLKLDIPIDRVPTSKYFVV